jgi:hypothetical protein
MRKKRYISREEAIQLAGKAMFGDAWIPDLTPREKELLRKYKPESYEQYQRSMGQSDGSLDGESTEER